MTKQQEKAFQEAAARAKAYVNTRTKYSLVYGKR